MAEVAEAWLATAEAGEGLFDWRYDPAAAAAAGAAADPDAGGLAARAAAHHAWLAFLGEAWQARPGGGRPPPDTPGAPPPAALDARTGCPVSRASWQELPSPACVGSRRGCGRPSLALAMQWLCCCLLPSLALAMQWLCCCLLRDYGYYETCAVARVAAAGHRCARRVQAWGEDGGADAGAVRAALACALQGALQAPRGLTRHPAAAGAVFRLLSLALRVARHGLVRRRLQTLCGLRV